MAWNPTADGALNLNSLRVAARLLPRSRAAHMHALVAATVPRPGATVQSLDVLRHLYIAAMRASITDWRALRVGYYLNHPRRLLDPAGFSAADAPYAPLPTGAALHDAAAGKPRLSCPTNPSKSSCFTDTPLVIMFIATDAYDAAVNAVMSPAEYSATAEEESLAGAEVDVDWCYADPVVAVTATSEANKLLREIAWRLRRRASTGDRQTIEELVAALRVAVGACLPGTSVANSQEDMGRMYEAFVSMNGWQRWFGAPAVSLVATTSAAGTPLRQPIFTVYAAESGPTSLRVKLKNADGAAAAFAAADALGKPYVEALQVLIDASTSTVSVEAASVRVGDTTDLDALASKSPELASKIDDLRLDAMPYAAERAHVLLDALLAIPGLKNAAAAKGISVPILLTAEGASSTADLFRGVDSPAIADAFAGVLGETLGKVDAFAAGVDMSTYTKSAKKTYNAARKETGEGMGGLKTEITTERVLADEPSSGVLMFDATALSNKWGAVARGDDDDDEQKFSTRVAVPRDRIIDITVGFPHARRTVEYRVFAVAIRIARTAASGHYWCYFWRGDEMFGYNDTESPVLWSVVGPGAVARAFADIEESGLFFFARRDDIADAADWVVWGVVNPPGESVKELRATLPLEASSFTVHGAELRRDDLASVFPTQFMTGPILDMYGAQAAAAAGGAYLPTYKAHYIAMNDNSAEYLEAEDVIKEALTSPSGVIFIPMMNFRGVGVPLEGGDHWSLLVLARAAGAGTITAKHYDSVGSNSMAAFRFVMVLQAAGIVPDTVDSEDVAVCYKQPASASPADPAASACGAITLGYIETWGAEDKDVRATDRKWRLKILDDISKNVVSVGARTTTVGENAGRVATLRRVLARMRREAENVYDPPKMNI